MVRLAELRRVVDCGSDLCSCSDVPLPVSDSQAAEACSTDALVKELISRGVLHVIKTTRSGQYLTMWRGVPS